MAVEIFNPRSSPFQRRLDTKRACHLARRFERATKFRLALSLGGTKAFAEIDLERFRRLAERAGLPVRLVMQTARETAAKVRDLWPTHEPQRALPEQIRAAVTAHMSRVPL